MPKRVIDFDAMWASDKIASCAEWAQPEYAWLYGLADASGSFEIGNLRVIWGRVAAVRQNFTLPHLTRVLDEFMARGLLFTWVVNGKRYGHWTGSDVPGRLPAPSWRMRLERLAPPVPRAELAAYMARFGSRYGAAVTPLVAAPVSANSVGLAPPFEPSPDASFNAAAGAASCLGAEAGEANANAENANAGDDSRKRGANANEEAEAADDGHKREKPCPRPNGGREQGTRKSSGAQPLDKCMTAADPTPYLGADAGPGLKPHLEETQAQDLGLDRDLNLGLDSSLDGERKGNRAEVCATAACETLLRIYDQERGVLPAAEKLTADRKRECSLLIGAGLDAEVFRAAVRKAACSPFLCGQGGRGWRASFDWFVGNQMNVRKVLEGRYDEGAPPGSKFAGAGSRGAFTPSLASELRVGVGPVAGDCGARVSAEALERIRAREAARECREAASGGAPPARHEQQTAPVAQLRANGSHGGAR